MRGASILLALLLGACDGGGAGAEPEASEPVVEEAGASGGGLLGAAGAEAPAGAAQARPVPGAGSEASASQPASQPAERVHAAAAGANAAAWDELFAMDPRTPVPLQPMMAWHQKQNMMEHLVAIERIVGALAEEDWDGVADASALIESSPQMAQMCNHMGAGAPGFTELALEFHERADAIGVAARQQDATAVLSATSHTLQACTSCHASFRQDVVDAATWAERTGSAHQPGMMHHGGH